MWGCNQNDPCRYSKPRQCRVQPSCCHKIQLRNCINECTYSNRYSICTEETLRWLCPNRNEYKRSCSAPPKKRLAYEAGTLAIDKEKKTRPKSVQRSTKTAPTDKSDSKTNKDVKTTKGKTINKQTSSKSEQPSSLKNKNKMKGMLDSMEPGSLTTTQKKQTKGNKSDQKKQNKKGTLKSQQTKQEKQAEDTTAKIPPRNLPGSSADNQKEETEDTLSEIPQDNQADSNQKEKTDEDTNLAFNQEEEIAETPPIQPSLAFAEKEETDDTIPYNPQSDQLGDQAGFPPPNQEKLTENEIEEIPPTDASAMEKTEVQEKEIMESKVASTVAEEQDYLLFKLQITEDLLSSENYTVDDIEELCEKHFNANKGRLDETKMREHIALLKDHLNYPACLCDEETVSDDECLCCPAFSIDVNTKKRGICSCTNPTCPSSRITKAEMDEDVGSSADDVDERNESKGNNAKGDGREAEDLQKIKQIDGGGGAKGEPRQSNSDPGYIKPPAVDTAEEKFTPVQAETKQPSPSPIGASVGTTEKKMSPAQAETRKPVPIPNGTTIGTTEKRYSNVQTETKKPIQSSKGTTPDPAKESPDAKQADPKQSIQSSKRAAEENLDVAQAKPKKLISSSEGTTKENFTDVQAGTKEPIPLKEQDFVQEKKTAQSDRSQECKDPAHCSTVPTNLTISEIINKRMDDEGKAIDSETDTKLSGVVFYNPEIEQACHCSVAIKKTALKIHIDSTSSNEQYVLVEGPICMPKTMLEEKTVPVLIENISTMYLDSDSGQYTEDEPITSKINLFKENFRNQPIENQQQFTMPGSISVYLDNLPGKIQLDEYDLTPEREKLKSDLEAANNNFLQQNENQEREVKDSIGSPTKLSDVIITPTPSEARYIVTKEIQDVYDYGIDSHPSRTMGGTVAYHERGGDDKISKKQQEEVKTISEPKMKTKFSRLSYSYESWTCLVKSDAHIKHYTDDGERGFVIKAPPKQPKKEKEEITKFDSSESSEENFCMPRRIRSEHMNLEKELSSNDIENSKILRVVQNTILKKEETDKSDKESIEVIPKIKESEEEKLETKFIKNNETEATVEKPESAPASEKCAKEENLDNKTTVENLKLHSNVHTCCTKSSFKDQSKVKPAKFNTTSDSFSSQEDIGDLGNKYHFLLQDAATNVTSKELCSTEASNKTYGKSIPEINVQGDALALFASQFRSAVKCPEKRISETSAPLLQTSDKKISEDTSPDSTIDTTCGQNRSLLSSSKSGEEKCDNSPRRKRKIEDLDRKPISCSNQSFTKDFILDEKNYYRPRIESRGPVPANVATVCLPPEAQYFLNHLPLVPPKTVMSKIKCPSNTERYDYKDIISKLDEIPVPDRLPEQISTVQGIFKRMEYFRTIAPRDISRKFMNRKPEINDNIKTAYDVQSKGKRMAFKKTQ